MALNVMITGHKGYIGSALYQLLSEYVLVDNLIGYDIIDGNDICDYDNLIRVMTNNQINLVVHLAAVSNITDCNNNSGQAIKINGKGTSILLRAMKASNCPNIIYASTCSVY